MIGSSASARTVRRWLVVSHLFIVAVGRGPPHVAIPH